MDSSYLTETLKIVSMQFSFIAACLTLTLYFCFKKKIYYYPSKEWLPIENNPIPEDINGFIGTDGKDVSAMRSITWAPHGKIYFSEFNKTYLTHWMPLPEAPKKESILRIVK